MQKKLFKTKPIKRKNWIVVNNITVFKKRGGGVYCYVNYNLFCSYKEGDTITEKFVIAILAASKTATQEELGEAFGIHRNTVGNYVKNLGQYGIIGLVSETSGPKSPKKITSEIRDTIIELNSESSKVEVDKIINEIKKRYDENIRRTSIYEVIKEEKRRQEELNIESGINIESEPEEIKSSDIKEPGRENTVDNDKKEEEKESGLHAEVEKVGIIEERGDLQKDIEKADERYLYRIKEGGANNYIAVLLVAGIVQKIGIVEIVKKLFNTLEKFKVSNKLYRVKEIILTILFMFLFKKTSLRSFRTVSRIGSGILIGREDLPSIKTLKRDINYIAAMPLARDLNRELAIQYGRLGIVEYGVLYIDSHVIPYFGNANIAKAYYTTRRIALKASKQYYANDKNGRPAFFYIKGANIKFTEVIIEMVDEALKIKKELGNEEPLIIVFDREGHDAKLFKKLDEMCVIFITYRKYSTEYPIEKFTEEIKVEYRSKEEEYKIYETTTSITGYRKDVPLIAVYNMVSDKQTSVITNCDKIKSVDLSNQEVVSHMLNRWGQENFFKLGMSEYKFNHGYGCRPTIINDQSEVLVNNPGKKELKKEIKKLKKELAEVNGKISHKFLENAKDEKDIQHYKGLKSYKKLSDTRSELSQEIECKKKKLKELDDYISYSELYGESPAPLEELNFEKQIMLNTLRDCAFNIKELLLDILRNHLKDKREWRDCLDTILWQRGTYKLYDDTIKIELNPFDTNQYQKAAKGFLEEINRMEPHTLDNFGFKLKFSVKPR